MGYSALWLAHLMTHSPLLTIHPVPCYAHIAVLSLKRPKLDIITEYSVLDCNIRRINPLVDHAAFVGPLLSVQQAVNYIQG